MFRQHCSHLQANLYRSSTFNVRKVWNPIVWTNYTVIIIIIIIIIIIGIQPLGRSGQRPEFAGSNPVEAVGFLREKKSSARLPSVGK